MIPRSGDLVRITKACGVVAVGVYLFQVQAVTTYPTTPDHMVYLAGIHQDANGKRIEYRPELFVIHAGIDLVDRPGPPTVTRRNSGPARIPQQRRPSSSVTSTNRTVR